MRPGIPEDIELQDPNGVEYDVIQRVCAAPIVRQALEERSRRGYELLSRRLVCEEYGPELAAVIVQFACPPGLIELPWSALRVIFYLDTLDVLSLADPYVAGKTLRVPEGFAPDTFDGALPFVLAVPLPRSFPVHETQVATSRLRYQRWAAMRGIDLTELCQMVC